MTQLFGLNVLITQDLPRMQLSADCPVTPEYRADTNAWMVQFFGTTNELSDTEVIVAEQLRLMKMNPRMFERLQTECTSADHGGAFGYPQFGGSAGMTEKRHPDQVYLDFDQFQDQDCDIKLRTKKLVKTRKPHSCLGGAYGTQHDIPAGTEVVYEQALVDGDHWGRYWMCLGCINKDLEELELA